MTLSKSRTSGSSSLPDHENGQSLTASAGSVELVNDWKDIQASGAGLELPVPVDPAGRSAFDMTGGRTDRSKRTDCY